MVMMSRLFVHLPAFWERDDFGVGAGPVVKWGKHQGLLVFFDVIFDATTWRSLSAR